MHRDDSSYIDFTKKPEFADILTNPILDIAARFWEDDRYEAFKICYRSMRVIDDLVDDRKSTGEAISSTDKTELKQLIIHWMEAFEKNKPIDEFQSNLIGVKIKFQIPLWPWQRLARAMIYDLYHDNFKSIIEFLRYSEGAAISPASIFMHLCGVKKSGMSFVAPQFDIRKAARTLALFSYFVHIIRDFQKDQLSNLNYFALDLLKKHQVSQSDLYKAAKNSLITDNFRKLIKQYYDIASYYRTKARITLDEVIPALTPQYQLSLEMIYSLYNQIFERIDWQTGVFTESELLPKSNEVKSRIENEIAIFRSKS